MTHAMATTEKEVELVIELRKLRKDLKAQIYNSPEFQHTLGLIQDKQEQLELERWAKSRAREAVQYLNDRPGVDYKLFKAFGSIAIFFSVTLVCYLYFSGDIEAKSWPAGVLILLTTVSALIYYFGYICQTRKQ
jgi:hypothetical protein